MKIQSIRCLSHFIRVNGSTPASKVYDAEPVGGSRGRRKRLLSWKDQVGIDLVSLSISNWLSNSEEKNQMGHYYWLSSYRLSGRHANEEGEVY